MLEVKELCGGYGKKKVIDGISFRFEEGRLYSVIGPNGSGKSTLLQLLCTLLPPMSGKVLIDGRDISEMKRTQLAQKISYLSQLHQSGSISVRSLVMHGRFPYLGYPRRYTEADKDAADRAIELAGMRDISDKNLSELSGGQQQRAYIAMLLAQDTPIVLLDEPSSYLDIKRQLEMRALAVKLKNTGKTVIMVSHDINSALCCSDITVVLDNGKIAFSGTSEEIRESGICDDIFGVRIVYSEAEKQYFYKEK